MQSVGEGRTRWWTGDRVLYALLLTALIVRGAAIVYLGNRALEYSSDAKAYQDIAVNLVERGRFITIIDPPHTLDKPYANRPPVTPWLLAGMYELFGTTLRYGQILLALIGVAACFFVYRLGTALFGPTVGLWACFLGAVNPLWVLLAAVPLTESVAILLYPLLALWSLRVLKVPSIRNGVITGALFGVVALNKATILAFAPVWVLWLGVALAPRWRRGLVIGAIAMTVCAAVLLPWTIRNYRLFGRVIPVTLQAGHSMFEANNPYTEYALRRVERGQTWLNDPRIYEPLEGLTGLSQVEFDDTSRALAVQFIREHPGQFVWFALRRLWAFWGPYDNVAHRVFWYGVLPLFAFGIVVAWKSNLGAWRQLTVPSLLILQTMSLVILFPSMPRYRVPVEPFVFIFAGYSIALIVRRMTAARASRVDLAPTTVGQG